jgi:hypothetical protein
MSGAFTPLSDEIGRVWCGGFLGLDGFYGSKIFLYVAFYE